MQFADSQLQGPYLCTMPLLYYAIYKPYTMLCQFTPDQEGDVTLAEFPYDFPKDCYTVGRLDKDSEGLLLLTNDNYLKNQFLSPKFRHSKTYFAQVEGVPNEAAVTQLQKGVNIKIKGKSHLTAPAKAKSIAAPTLPERNPPIRYRANIPTSWLSITLTEGKNRQVRRMCAAVGFPVLRLVRYGMGRLKLEDIPAEGVKEFDKKEIYDLLGIV